ncbi:MAG TPA: winged helix DNA-binding protein [Ktedonobacterales bacterium]|nr:winged helix DNA-binding protein [Ktedonobacterales bacterium]
MIREILALLAKITEKFDTQEGESWQWITQHSSNPQVVELLQDTSITTMRVINAIGRLEPVNGATISAQFRIPKGTVSKITRRLIAKQLVSTESLPHNKKEILFRLTPLGRELFEVNRDFDGQMERGFIRFLQRYDADALHTLARVLRDATEASFITLALQEPSQEHDVETKQRRKR